MPVFRTPVGRTIPFFDTLTGYLESVAKEADITLHRLSGKPDGYSKDEHVDLLLVREGRALMAVTIAFSPSGFSPEWVEAPSYQGTAGEEGNLEDLATGLADRLRKELPKKEEPKVEIPEATWAIGLRGPAVESQTWTGSPFEIDTLEKAFAAIVDAIVARSKP